MRRFLLAATILLAAAVAITLAAKSQTSTNTWHLTKESEALVPDATLRNQIFRALDAAEHSGTDPAISKFKVRAATVITINNEDHVILGGNSEYRLPEGIHGETSLINHAINEFGPEAVKAHLKFEVFYNERCGAGASCGDCRDYQKHTLDYKNLLMVCGQAVDHAVRVTRFKDQIVDEDQFPEATAEKIGITQDELKRLTDAAEIALNGGITLFLPATQTAASALSYNNKIYRAAAADDAAFHYRYPVAGALQDAATERDYLLKAVLVVGEKGKWPIVNYRDRQYGFESSSFNHAANKPPIALIITDGLGHYRATTFEAALPHAFSTADFDPAALQQFLSSHLTK
jgi:cytidine deaminase